MKNKVRNSTMQRIRTSISRISECISANKKRKINIRRIEAGVEKIIRINHMLETGETKYSILSDMPYEEVVARLGMHCKEMIAKLFEEEVKNLMLEKIKKI